MSWAHPAASAAVLITKEEELQRHASVISDAAVCGIDCEWPPEQTGHRPAASLVQLALWSLAGGARVLLLDMVQLPRGAALTVLQALFRNPSTLKLAYGWGADLSAIASALGADGASAVAVVHPAVDAGSLHAFLLHRGAPGLYATAGRGLNGLIAAQLGAELDKAQQCSAWGRRSLTPAQLLYAANDACCLLALLDNLIQCVGRPEEWPMNQEWLAEAQEQEEEVEEAEQKEAVEEVEQKDAAAEVEAEVEQVAYQGEGSIGAQRPGTRRCSRMEDEGAAAEGVTPQQTGSIVSFNGAKPPAPEPPHASADVAWTPEQLRAACAAWGRRLECVGGRARWRDLSGKLHAQPWALATASPTLKSKNGKGAAPEDIPDFPAHVPWMDARRQLTAPPRFLADVMAHGLARQLRLWGVDAEAVEVVGKNERHRVHRQLVERAEREHRVILTRDLTFLRRRLCDCAYFVRADTKREQLREVVEAFRLPVQVHALLSRCARCNGEFGPAPVPAGELPLGHGVPEAVAARVAEFWVCSRCESCFWQGSMYDRAMERLTAALEAMSTAEGSAAQGGGSAQLAGYT